MGLTPTEAQASQHPEDLMTDTIEPKTNVTLPQSNDMGLNSIDLENLIKDRIDNILKNHFIEKFPKA